MSRRRKPATSRRHSPQRKIRLHHIAVAVREAEATHLAETGRHFTLAEREQAHRHAHTILKDPGGSTTT